MSDDQTTDPTEPIEILSGAALGIQLVQAIQSNDPNTMEKLLNGNKEVVPVVMGNTSLLHWSASSMECVKVLAKHKLISDVNVGDDSKATALHWAAQEGNLEMVKYLLSIGANPDAKDDVGEKAIHWAALNGHSQIIEHFLSVGVAGNSQAEQNGYTPLHLATLNAHLKCVALLLSHKVDTNLKDKQGKTAKMIAQDKSATAPTLIDYFSDEKRQTLETISKLQEDLMTTRSELNTIRDEKEIISKKLMQTMKDHISSQNQITEQQEQITTLQNTLERERTEHFEKIKTLTEQFNAEKEKMQSNLTNNNLKNSNQQQQQQSNSTSNNSIEGEQLQRENAALMLEITRLRKESSDHQKAKNILIRLNHNFSDLQTYLNATLRNVDNTRDELQSVLSSSSSSENQ